MCIRDRIDTAGIEPDSEDIILSQMREQANLAVSMADVIVFLTDIRQGITAADQEIAVMLKKSGKPIVLVCNKADNFEKDREEIYEFYNLGLGDPYPVSYTHLPPLPTAIIFPDGDEPYLPMYKQDQYQVPSDYNRIAHETELLLSPTP